MKTMILPGKHPRTLSKRRIFTVCLCFLLFAAYLVTSLFRLQFFAYEKYKAQVYEQITTSSALRANRGSIYDRNMNLLAASRTVWRVFVSTREIQKAKKQSGKAYDRLIADGLGEIFGLDKDALLKKIQNTKVLDVTIKRAVSEQDYKRVLRLIEAEQLQHLVFTEAGSARYYPGGSFAAHTLGFTGSDNQGLYGLEYSYEEVLKGKDGYYLYAKDAGGNALPGEYATYVAPEDGNSLVTTIDSYIQSVLESEVESALQNHGAQNRVCAVAMDVNSGAVLGMATSAPFDANDPYTLTGDLASRLAESGYVPGTEEYKKEKAELLSIMWSNKAVSELYEPGSTFKIITVSAALDSGSAKLTDHFSCSGAHTVGGYRIRCHKATGHGAGFTLGYGLQMSCNPTMMQIADRMGADTFYEYVKRFGYFEKTGIDLPSEATSIFHKKENIGSTELATASFGQRFKVSIIGQLTAIATVANGGKSVTPYLVERIVDKDGNVVSTHREENEVQVISPEVAAAVADVLEGGVSGDGGAKNAAVAGYKIAAKTGTSQKFDILDANGHSYLRVGSTVGFSMSTQDRGVAVIFIVDEPTSTVKYGSTVAAPYVGNIFEKILPYLGEESTITPEPLQVNNYVGMQTTAAVAELKSLGIPYLVIGEGDSVLSQTPTHTEHVNTSLSRVILYTVKAMPERIAVPNVLGKSPAEANTLLLNSGLNIYIRGVSTNIEHAKVTEQSLPPGSYADRGAVIVLTVLHTDFED